MPPFRIRRRLRRPLIWLLIAQQIVVGAGGWLSCPAATTPSAERYPCEHCGCGCLSAEQCWTHCCCYTPQQKIAWARANGVAVPAVVFAAAAREAASPRKSKCAHCGHHDALKTEGPANHTLACDCQTHREHGNRVSKRISWLNAMQCRGLTQQWQASVVSSSGDPHVEFSPALLARDRAESQPYPQYHFSPPSPPTPPPKAA